MNQSVKRLLKQVNELAKKGLATGNYPIGALITDSKYTVLKTEHNKSKTNNDPAAHAELLCLRGLKKTNTKIYLFSSLEPCYGCSFFLRYTNVCRVYWNLSDNYKGGFRNMYKDSAHKSELAKIRFFEEPFNSLKEESRKLMFSYFTNLKNTKTASFYLEESQ